MAAGHTSRCVLSAVHGGRGVTVVNTVFTSRPALCHTEVGIYREVSRLWGDICCRHQPPEGDRESQKTRIDQSSQETKSLFDASMFWKTRMWPTTMISSTGWNWNYR